MFEIGFPNHKVRIYSVKGRASGPLARARGKNSVQRRPPKCIHKCINMYEYTSVVNWEFKTFSRIKNKQKIKKTYISLHYVHYS